MSKSGADLDADMAIAGYVLTGAGSILWTVSIPVLSVANGRKKAIKSNFAKKYFGVYSGCLST